METKNITVGDIDFKDTPVLTGALMYYKDMISDTYTTKYQPNLEGNDDKIIVEAGANVIHFDNQRDIIYLKMGCFAISYKDKSIRNKDKNLFNNLKLKDSRQLQKPVLYGEFEYNNKFWLMLSAEKRLLGPTNDITLYGMIVNPEKYLENNGIGLIQKTFAKLLRPFKK